MDFNSNPLVSIIIPIYNVENYLEQCIISVVHQTYKNLEIILVNDGSPDNSFEICKQWKRKDSRIKLINKDNGGLSDARNCGLRVASGELVLFVDSDDWISINMVENMVNKMIQNDVDLVVCDFIRAFPDGFMEKNNKQDFPPKVVSVEEFLKLVLEDKVLTNHAWRRLYKKKYIPKDVFPKNRNFEDIFSTPKFVENMSKVLIVNDAYYFYRVNDSSIVNNLNYKNVKDHFDAILMSNSIVMNSYSSLASDVQRALPSQLKVILRDAKKVIPQDNEIKNLIQDIKFSLKSYSIFKTASRKDFFDLLELKYFNNLYYWYKKIRDNKMLRKIAKQFLAIPKFLKVKKLLTEDTTNTFYILGAPRYGNLGDLALLRGEVEFIQKYFSNYKIKEITGEKISYISENIKLSKSSSIYALQAGGNIGTLYPGIHLDQEGALRNINTNNLMIFPQTFYYDTTTQFGRELLEQSCKLYQSKKIQVFVREKSSFEFLSEEFQNVEVSLVPDIALMIDGTGYSKAVEERDGLFLCLRNDSERTLTNEKLDIILTKSEQYFGSNIIEGDTHRYNDDVDDDTFKYVEPLLETIGTKRMMVTDRLHGMIFAAITNTPCIVITSKSPKVKGVYQWIKHLPYIKLVEDLEDLDNAFEAVLAVENPHFDNSNLQQEFEKMANSIRNGLENRE
ncbi:TPA: glycosyltransferase [Streptococcus suis]